LLPKKKKKKIAIQFEDFMMSNALDLLLTYKNQKLVCSMIIFNQLVLIFLLSVLDTMRVSGSTFLRY